MGRRSRVGSGRVPTWVGLVAVLATLAAAQAASAQPVRRLAGLDDPFSGVTEKKDSALPTMSPVPPRTSYQPPPQRDPAGVPYQPDFTLPDGSVIPVPQSKTRQIRLGRRYNTPNNEDSVRLPDGTRRSLLTGGWVVNVESIDGKEATEFAADDVVLWVRGLAIDNVQNGFTTNSGKTEVEVYMSGNVIIRTRRSSQGPVQSSSGRATVSGSAKQSTQTLRAQEVYYDAENNRAVALRADLEMALPNVPDPLHMRGEEIRRLDLENWEILNGAASASKLPSDPGLVLDSQRFTLSERRTVRRNIFGLPFRDIRTGEKVESLEQIITGQNVVTRLDGVPVFYLPTLRTNASDPLGPLQSIGYGQARQFGPSVYTTWDFYELLALRPPPGHSWRLYADYLSKRGPATGSDYYYNILGEPGTPQLGTGMVRLYGISDKGTDLLGGDRGPEPTQPDLRGRFLWRHQQEVMEGLYFQGQVGLLSDKNFFEQYYKNEFDMGPNQETFAYLAWQRRNFGATALAEDRVTRQWVTETNWLPQVNGHLIGQTFLDDLFVYSTRGQAAYAQLRPAEDSPYPLLSTDRRPDNTGRFDLWQELSVPFALGPVKLAPYGVLDLTEYTSDLNGNEVGRVYGAGGARASLPFSRLYDDVSSELLNLKGIYHKVVFGANYRYARTNVPYSQLPLLDRLNDDATDQSWRNITPFQPQYVPGLAGQQLAAAPGYSPFNPQLYAIRRVVENRIDTLDNINVLQADVRQRFQTKRGYPGLEHTVDALTFDVSASYFPDANRDNFGHPFSFLEYAGIWNVGDRTALVSNGWFEPYSGGSRYWTAGVYLSRTDRTNIYAGYRQTDPLNSKAVSLSLGYQLSPRYYLSGGATYDFGIQAALSNSLLLTRTGTDLTVSIGFTYTAFVNSFGFQFLIVPNLATSIGRFSGSPMGGQAAGLNRR